MPFIVKGCTGEESSTQRWVVGVCTHQDTAQSKVSRLNTIASECGVLTPKEVPEKFFLSFEDRDTARQLLSKAGDLSIPELDYNGVCYEYQEVHSLD